MLSKWSGSFESFGVAVMAIIWCNLSTMKLKLYLKSFDATPRAAFAVSVGTTLAHLNNVQYGSRTASAALARQIAKATAREVAEWDLRPADWHLIWPELMDHPNAPPPPADDACNPTDESRDAA